MVYGISSYSKGTVFLTQLGYLIGAENMMKTLKRYYHDYKFTHPTPNDFKRTAERVSGAVLDWYLVDWTQTTNTIDYGIKNIDDSGKITLERIGRTPMPLDILVVYEDDSMESFYVPNPLMRFEKENPYPQIKRTVLKDWDWAYPTYEFSLSQGKAKIKSMLIDPSGLMADVNKENNYYEKVR
jgi:aminopeptidase N